MVYDDLVCRGCKRFHHEVVSWSLCDAGEKRAVWSRLEQLLVQVMAAKLGASDVARLRLQLEQRQIRFVPKQSPYCWAYQLIARGSQLINQIEAYGVALLPEFRNWSLSDLHDAIDREFFLLSEAHYQRYIVPSFLQVIGRQVVPPAKKSPLGGLFARPAVTPCWPVPPDG